MQNQNIIDVLKLRNALLCLRKGQDKVEAKLSPDFLALGPPLLEGVLLLVGPLHPGHLVLLQVLLQWGIRSTLVRLILWDNGR